jgi:Protein of unknown function (DUF3237)
METALLFEVSFDLADPIVLSDTPDGTRMIFHVTGGKFEGPRLRGTVLPSGGDWLVQRPDGLGALDVRGLIKTDDGELIYVTYNGRTNLAAGSIRTAPLFCTSMKGKYAWLNAVQAVAEGAPLTGKDGRITGVKYRVYEVK